MEKQRGPVGTYFFQVAVAFDRLLNTVITGSADETLSSRAYRMRLKKQPYWGWTADMIDRLFFWQDQHCFTSWLNEVHRKNPAIDTDLAGAHADILDPLLKK